MTKHRAQFTYKSLNLNYQFFKLGSNKKTNQRIVCFKVVNKSWKKVFENRLTAKCFTLFTARSFDIECCLKVAKTIVQLVRTLNCKTKTKILYLKENKCEEKMENKSIRLSDGRKSHRYTCTVCESCSSIFIDRDFDNVCAYTRELRLEATRRPSRIRWKKCSTFETLALIIIHSVEFSGRR